MYFEDYKTSNKMTAKAALAKALLDGRVLNVKNCFQTIGLTNCAREISRAIEQPFGVEVSRTQMEGKSRYGQPVTWVNYRLNHTEYNSEGIKKMHEYVNQQLGISEPIQSTQQFLNEWQNEQIPPTPKIPVQLNLL